MCPKPTLTIDDQAAEAKLIAEAQGDPARFKPLYEMYFRRIFVFVLHRVNDRSLTADITSQVFLKAMINIGKYRSQGVPFSAWLFRIALNECNDFFRRSKRHRFVAIPDEGLHGLHEEMTADSGPQDLLLKLPGILEQLKEHEVHLLELRFFEQRSFREVGEILGLSETHAKVKVYRLLEKMRKLFPGGSITRIGNQ